MARRSTVKIEARADYSTEYERIPKEEYDPDEHTRFEEREKAQPSDQLVDLLGTRQANRLAEAGLTTIVEGLAYDGDLTELNGVGDSTVDALLEASSE